MDQVLLREEREACGPRALGKVFVGLCGMVHSEKPFDGHRVFRPLYRLPIRTRKLQKQTPRHTVLVTADNKGGR